MQVFREEPSAAAPSEKEEESSVSGLKGLGFKDKGIKGLRGFRV